jgi:hypothetical protein
LVAIPAKHQIFSALLIGSGIPTPLPEIPRHGEREESMLTLSSTIRRTDSPDGAVLLDVEQGQMFCLNPMGSRILELIEAGYGENEIALKLSASFSQNIETVRADVGEFLESLRRHHILQHSVPAQRNQA